MNILPQLEALKKFILENTKPPLTTELLNKLSFITEQAEANAERGDKQDNTLATQIETIERLVKENKAVVAENTQLKDATAKRNAMLDLLQAHSQKTFELQQERELKRTD